MTRYQITWRVVLLYVALTLLFTYPVWVHPATRVMWASDDTNLFAWTLSWDTYAFTHHPLSIFDANIYYPERYTLAYSENLIGSAVIAAPVLWLTANPILAINVVALLSCVLCGVGTYVLARRVGISPSGAILAGMVFAFAPPRLLRFGQLHLTTVQWLPFGLACLHAYLDEGRKSDLRLAIAFLSLQVVTSGHGAVFLTLSMALLLTYRFALGEPLALTRRLRDVGLAGLLLLLPAVLVMIPYQVVQHEMGLKRTLEDWATSAESFLSSPAHAQQYLLSWLPGLRIRENAQAHLFPGFLPILLALAACVPGRGMRGGRARTAPRSRDWWHRAAVVLETLVLASAASTVYVALAGPVKLILWHVRVLAIRDAVRPGLVLAACVMGRLALASRVPLAPAARWRRGWRTAADAVGRAAAGACSWPAALRGNVTLFYALLTVLSLLLAAPPPLGLWPNVYWLPGLNFIRVPSRITILALLGLAVLAGIGFDRLTAWLSPRRRVASAVGVAVLLAAELAAMPLSPSEYAVEIPPIDRWLATRPVPFAIAEVPLADPDNTPAFERRQSTFMLHSMAHWQKTIHAFSGFRPLLHDKLYEQMGRFPDLVSLRSLARLRITYIVVHTDLYRPGEWDRVDSRIRDFGAWLTLEHVEGAGRVYSLHDAELGKPRDDR
ncbi:MAG TPA: hypothetical protein VF332_11065 [Vicinamibacterales bacterium]